MATTYLAIATNFNQNRNTRRFIFDAADRRQATLLALVELVEAEWGDDHIVEMSGMLDRALADGCGVSDDTSMIIHTDGDGGIWVGPTNDGTVSGTTILDSWLVEIAEWVPDATRREQLMAMPQAAVVDLLLQRETIG